MEEEKKSKRLVAEVSSEFFWEVKKGLADRQIKIKDFIILTCAYLLNIDERFYTVDIESKVAFERFLDEVLSKRKGEQ